jgi:predicted PurR-regulated permease PerM
MSGRERMAEAVEQPNTTLAVTAIGKRREGQVMDKQPDEYKGEEKREESNSAHGKYFFYICLLLCFVTVFLVWRPFIITILMSMICAAVLYPLYVKLVKLFRGGRTLASLTTCLILIVLVFGPLSLLVVFLAQEATDFYAVMSIKLQQGFSILPTTGPIANIVALIREYLPTVAQSTDSLRSQATELVKMFVSLLLTHSTSWLANVSTFILHFFLFLFTLFYFLRDGSDWLKDFSAVIPLPENQTKLILEKFIAVSKSTVVAILLTALCQGMLAGIGFWIAGISPVLWGTATAFASLIPMVGAAIVWLPAGLILLAMGKIWAGLFLLIWGIVLISSADNFLRPFLMQGATEVSPVWILFSILGGLDLFGFAGILIGPLLLSMAITLILIYKEAYAH